jgi:hypothetical protein
MASSPRERTPHERETLIFANQEAAQGFRENLQPKLTPTVPGVDQGREHVAAAVAEQFHQAGEAVQIVREPWEHTPSEHQEAEALVDVAFAQDLPAAIKKARQSSTYPRNLDLLHDVLTGELYALVKEGQLRHQPVWGWLLALVAIGTLAIVGVVVFLRLLS